MYKKINSKNLSHDTVSFDHKGHSSMDNDQGNRVQLVGPTSPRCGKPEISPRSFYYQFIVTPGTRTDASVCHKSVSVAAATIFPLGSPASLAFTALSEVSQST